MASFLGELIILHAFFDYVLSNSSNDCSGTLLLTSSIDYLFELSPMLAEFLALKPCPITSEAI